MEMLLPRMYIYWFVFIFMSIFFGFTGSDKYNIQKREDWDNPHLSWNPDERRLRLVRQFLSLGSAGRRCISGGEGYESHFYRAWKGGKLEGGLPV